MLMAFTWWAILLYTKNQDAFQAKAELMRMGMAAEQTYVNEETFVQNADYQLLALKYKHQESMIFGEALFFFFTLLIGIWLIHRSYTKEILAAQQRRNFLLSITHELKSPIASVRLLLETFLKRNLEKNHSDQLTKTALKETDRLTYLVDNLLLAAKLETAYLPVFEVVNIQELIENIIFTQKEKHPNAEIYFTNCDAVIWANLDKLGFSSVLINLLENAIKYSPNAPKIELKTSLIANELHLQVADCGIGISDKEKRKIFQKFYRVGNEDTRKTKGTGLGLFIVSQIVKAHEGTIQITDNQPTGTIFKLTFSQN